MKGIVLAGGTGSRLFPLTKITNKHLLPIYDKPMIYYPIQTLVNAGIRDILIVTGGRNAGDFLRLLANGKEFGLSHLDFTYQEGEGGIAEALRLAEHFADGHKICVILGDNIIEGSIANAITAFCNQPRGAKILLKQVPDAERFGVAEFNDGHILSIEEKPKCPKSNYAVTGIYMYDPTVFDKIRTLVPSGRGELEITDVNNAYIGEGTMTFSTLEGWWTDAGTFESLLRATILVAQSRGARCLDDHVPMAAAVCETGVASSVAPEAVMSGCEPGIGSVVVASDSPKLKHRGRGETGLTTPKRILLSVPHMGGNETGYVGEAFSSNWLSTVGPNVAAFEREFEARIGLPAVALGSGTAAMHLALRLLGVGPGDEVFCPTLTFVATANPIRYLGAEPVFIDSERASWNLDPELLRRALSERRPKAVVVVHLYGQCSDMDPILAACAAYGVPVLEDAAEALGSNYRVHHKDTKDTKKEAGTMGDIGVYSFNGNKIITTTGGGMLVSRRREWVDKARFWATQARDAGLAYEHSEMGYNYRMSNVLAGIGRGQLEVLDLRVAQRRGIAFRYRDAFLDLPGISLMPQASYGLHTNWLSCFLIEEEEFGCSRDKLIATLDAAGVESRPVWKPMHLQPLYASAARYGGEAAEDLFRRGICLPSSSSLSEAEQSYVINAVRSSAGELAMVATK